MAPFQILVLCTGNSARSQIAEALIATLGAQRAAGRITAASAGSHPAAQVNPGAVAVLAAHGIKWVDRTPRHVDAIIDRPFALVISVCDNARDACPILPGARATVHWGLSDPAAYSEPVKVRAAFAATYDALRARIEALLALPLETLSPSDLSARAAKIHRSHPVPTFE